MSNSIPVRRRSTWKRKASALAIVATSMAMALTGCAVDKSGTDSTASVSASAAASVTDIKFASPFPIKSLEPIQWGHWGMRFGYAETLMKPQQDGAAKPWLLKSLDEVNTTTWKLTLNPDITFQDGKKLDGAALAKSMNYTLANDEDVAATIPGGKVTATGDLTATLTTKTPVAFLPQMLSTETGFKIFDADAVEKAGKDVDKLTTAGIYTGPYTVTSLTDQKMTLKANDHYWKGTPKLKNISVTFVQDANASTLAVQNGEVDVALYAPTSVVKTVKNRSDSFVTMGQASGDIAVRMMLNVTQSPMNDAAVRRAVQSAVDYDQIANELFSGVYTPVTGMYSSRMPYAVKTQSTDVAKANKLLDDAGWKLDPKTGARSKDGKKLAFTLYTYPQQADYTPLVLNMQASLKKVGMTVNIKSVPDINEAIKDPKTWQTALMGTGTLSGNEPISGLKSFYLSNSPSNFTGISNKTLDADISTLGQTLDETRQNELLRSIQKIVGDNAYEVFVGSRKAVTVVDPRWKSFHTQPFNVWIDVDTHA